MNYQGTGDAVTGIYLSAPISTTYHISKTFKCTVPLHKKNR